RPTVLLLHGGPGFDHSTYKGADAMVLDDVAQVVFYDHRGNGRSDRGTPEQWTLDTWADDVVRLCDALEIVKPVVVGASFGGFVAQRYLARHPDHPSKVVLACTSARLDVEAISTRFTQLGGEAAGAAARQLFGGDISVMPAFLEHCIPLYATEPPDPDAMARAVMNPELMAHFFTGEATTMDLRTGLAVAECPVLVLGGELDPVMPREMVREMVGALPPNSTQFEEIPGVSHLQVAGRPASNLVKAFIQNTA
ncbi:MAG: alpha/beta hydrolase fold, partial [Ilumatobacteraceae bacterium]|nr:alpha/beta hydrolase fold [Ilumatobacteraceae bacterium]